MRDTILCKDKDDAKRVIDEIGSRYIDEFEYKPDGKVLIILTHTIKQIKQIEKMNEERKHDV